MSSRISAHTHTHTHTMQLHHQHKLGDDPLLVYNLHFITRVAKGFITDRKRYTHTHTEQSSYLQILDTQNGRQQGPSSPHAQSAWCSDNVDRHSGNMWTVLPHRPPATSIHSTVKERHATKNVNNSNCTLPKSSGNCWSSSVSTTNVLTTSETHTHTHTWRKS
jgi:hypothetical protein